MPQRPRRETFYRILLVVAVLYGIALFIAGIGWISGFSESFSQHRRIEWQEYSMALLLVSFLPLIILGRTRPRMASLLLLSGAALTIAQILGISGSTGDGLAPTLLGATAFIGLPMTLAALLFRWRSS